MQDFQPIQAGLTGRILTSPGSGTSRRGLPSSSSSTQQQSPQQAAIKCPRCDSTNTKFCYYNNYNLSQPRYFCKSCRRYWTKGGVLRNVPVGGGCRKNSSSSKRTSKSSSSKPVNKTRRKPAAASGSSSESSSTLTAANLIPDPDPILEVPILPEGAGSFSNLTGHEGLVGFTFPDLGLMSGLRVADPGAEKAVDLRGADGVNGSGLDWSGSLFNITSSDSVDPAAYWNQNHWADTDPSLFLP